MKTTLRAAILAGTAIGFLAAQLPCQAQNAVSAKDNATQPTYANSAAAMSSLASEKDEQPVDLSDSTDPATSSSAAATPAAANPAASVALPIGNDAIIKEPAEMKARIAQLESELKASRGTEDGASAKRDAEALRLAEGATVSGASSSSVTPAVQAATAAPAALAPPEISAQTTTKGEPFEGDWTWLNSNGHAVDSPMSTKYFTPEFRADANYILDYNHPHDDTMGGATESFRSDEWQLEQISIQGFLQAGTCSCICEGISKRDVFKSL
jgi:hypothetical protein